MAARPFRKLHEARMRTPIEVAAVQVAPVAEKPRVLARDGIGAGRPFSHILADAEAVQDVVRLSGRISATDSALPAWRDAWAGLCRGANLLVSGELGRAFRGKPERGGSRRR
jgi:hypothetical protein